MRRGGLRGWKWETWLALAAALADPNVQRFIAGKGVRKAIHVPDKLVNLVV